MAPEAFDFSNLEIRENRPAARAGAAREAPHPIGPITRALHYDDNGLTRAGLARKLGGFQSMGHEGAAQSAGRRLHASAVRRG